MSHIRKLPDELYTALQEAADATGTTPLGWIAARLIENRVKTALSTFHRSAQELRSDS